MENPCDNTNLNAEYNNDAGAPKQVPSLDTNN